MKNRENIWKSSWRNKVIWNAWRRLFDVIHFSIYKTLRLYLIIEWIQTKNRKVKRRNRWTQKSNLKAGRRERLIKEAYWGFVKKTGISLRR